jgi:hypothetical protein
MTLLLMAILLAGTGNAAAPLPLPRPPVATAASRPDPQSGIADAILGRNLAYLQHLPHRGEVPATDPSARIAASITGGNPAYHDCFQSCGRTVALQDAVAHAIAGR